MTEAFPFLNPLNSIPGIRAGWIERIPEVPVVVDRDEAMAALRPYHEREISRFAPGALKLWRAEQVHGADVATVPSSPEILAPDGLPVVPGVDGLISTQASLVLAIYTADCGAIWLADRKTKAIGLLHSGKKGTEGNILEAAVEKLVQEFGSQREDLVAVLSPSIRVPDYDIDFTGEIAQQAKLAGIGSYTDSELNTAADLERFYSYRKEMGKTGRMMALIYREPAL